MYEQPDLFSHVTPRFYIDRPVRMIELFAGIGSQYKAMKRIGADVEAWKVVEWDKYAMASYNAIHGTDFETSDIQNVHAADLEIVERESYIYLLTYSFPCQDISGAGLQKGLDKGSGTRSGLLWEVERILDECGENLPQLLMLENVPLLVGKKNIKNFQLWRRKLEQLGYSNYVQLLNAKDYGIPQNRNRVFMISILGDYYYEFPKPIPLKLRLKDMLEDQVDEKYYVSEKGIKYITRNERLEKKYTQLDGDIAVPVTAEGIKNWTGSFITDQPLCIGSVREHASVTTNGICPTIDTMQGGGRTPMITENEKGKAIV